MKQLFIKAIKSLFIPFHFENSKPWSDSRDSFSILERSMLGGF